MENNSSLSLANLLLMGLIQKHIRNKPLVISLLKIILTEFPGVLNRRFQATLHVPLDFSFASLSLYSFDSIRSSFFQFFVHSVNMIKVKACIYFGVYYY